MLREIDKYSYELGVMDCFCEMTASGLKKLAMSHPCDTKEERDLYLGEAEALCEKYGIRYYPEDEAFLTDLFPPQANKGKYNFLFFRTEDVLKEYLDLKKQQEELIQEGAYGKEERKQIAEGFGRLLSYPEEGIKRLMEKAAPYWEEETDEK